MRAQLNALALILIVGVYGFVILSTGLAWVLPGWLLVVGVVPFVVVGAIVADRIETRLIYSAAHRRLERDQAAQNHEQTLRRLDATDTDPRDTDGHPATEEK